MLLRLLAIDLGSRLVGWAYFHGPELLGAGTWDLEPKRKQSRGMRWLRLLGHLDSVAHANYLDLVCYEEVRRHEGTSAAHAYGAALGHLEAWVERQRRPGDEPDEGLQITSVTVAAVKQSAVGKGGGPGTDKEAVLAAARARWPRFVPAGSDPKAGPPYDCADACFIGLAQLIELGLATGADPMPKAKAKTKKQRALAKEPALF